MAASDEIAELRAASDTMFWCQSVSELVGGLRQLYLIRNKDVSGMDPAKVQQRRLLLEVVIQMFKNELKTAVREMVTKQELWETMENRRAE